jgi:hypothetical protein
MSAADQPAPAPTAANESDFTPLGLRLLNVAWMSILLGLVMQLIIVAVVTYAGSSSNGASFLVDAVQKVSWSFLVCVGLALGSVAARAVRAVVMGVLGLLAAPVAFTVARMTNKAATQLMGVVPPTMAAAPSVMWLAVIKALEFACLGFAVGWLAGKTWGNIRAHLAVGLAVGLVFGGIVVAYTLGASDPKPPAAKIVGLALNELFYPAGCALILYAAGVTGSKLAQATSE